MFSVPLWYILYEMVLHALTPKRCPRCCTGPPGADGPN